MMMMMMMMCNDLMCMHLKAD